MKLRTWFAAGCLAWVGGAGIGEAGPGTALARDLTIAVDPVLVDPVRQAYLEPFTAESGLGVAEAAWHGGLEPLRAAATEWDLVLTDSATLGQGCAAGVLDRIDVAKLLGRDRFVVAPEGCGVPGLAWGTVLAWDRGKFQGVPSWADFWDVAKHPGKRGLLRGARQTLELALLGDGVAPGDVYAALRGSDGVDRAFRKLDQLRPYIVWYDAADEATSLIGTGAVLLTSADSRVIEAGNRAGHGAFGTQWDRSLMQVESWALPKGSVNRADAEHLLALVSDPARQAALAGLVPWVAVARPAPAADPAADPPTSASAPAPPSARPNLAAALPVDEQFWRDNQPQLDQRFSEWMAK